MSTTRSLLLASSLVALALVACTVDATNTGGSSGSTASGDKKSSSTGGSETTDPPSSTTTSADTATCAAKPDLDTCIECCAGGDETAFKVADDAFQACACGATGVCKTECAADYCTGDKTKEPSQSCLDCLDTKAASCDESASTACQGDAKCKAASACAKSACASKDEQ